jgi:hypothetical protein
MATSKDVLRGTDALILSSRQKARSTGFAEFADYMAGRISMSSAARRRFSLAYPVTVDQPSFDGIVSDVREAQERTDSLSATDTSVRSWGRELDDVVSGLNQAARSSNGTRVLAGLAAVAVGTGVYLAARRWNGSRGD